MWLLDTETRGENLPDTLKYFKESELPAYAILSHTWYPDPEQEVSFQDMKNGTGSTKPGYKKIQQCCKKAKARGIRYCWIDSCCINKESSTELSEAINSMFLWYRQAQVCFAYLEDVSKGFHLQKKGLSQSRWFTRGWTLQELVAPKDVIFYDSEWQKLGTKESLCSKLARITGISGEYLLDRERIHTASVAARMSWAAKRQTSREEDIAYCLLGIFGVSMSLIYGERAQAFIRLQEEIAKTIDDESLYAWETSNDDEYSGFLARSPRDFLFASTIELLSGYRKPEPIAITPRGLKYTMPIIRDQDEKIEEFLGVLYCHDHMKHDQYMIGVRLRSRHGFLKPGEQLERVPKSKLVFLDADILQGDIKTTSVYISQKGFPTEKSQDADRGDNDVLVVVRHHGEPCLGGSVRVVFPACNTQQDKLKPYARLNPLALGHKHVAMSILSPDQGLLYLVLGFGHLDAAGSTSDADHDDEGIRYWYYAVSPNYPNSCHVSGLPEAEHLNYLWRNVRQKYRLSSSSGTFSYGPFKVILSMEKQHMLGLDRHVLTIDYAPVQEHAMNRALSTPESTRNDSMDPTFAAEQQALRIHTHGRAFPFNHPYNRLVLSRLIAQKWDRHNHDQRVKLASEAKNKSERWVQELTYDTTRGASALDKSILNARGDSDGAWLRQFLMEAEDHNVVKRSGTYDPLLVKPDGEMQRKVIIEGGTRSMNELVKRKGHDIGDIVASFTETSTPDLHLPVHVFEAGGIDPVVKPLVSMPTRRVVRVVRARL